MHKSVIFAMKNIIKHVFMLFFLALRYPFNDDDHAKLFVKVRQGQYNIPNETSRAARCLIRSLLNQNPNNRPNPGEILNHAWIIKGGQVEDSLFAKRGSNSNSSSNNPSNNNNLTASSRLQQNSAVLVNLPASMPAPGTSSSTPIVAPAPQNVPQISTSSYNPHNNLPRNFNSYYSKFKSEDEDQVVPTWNG